MRITKSDIPDANDDHTSSPAAVVVLIGDSLEPNGPQTEAEERLNEENMEQDDIDIDIEVDIPTVDVVKHNNDVIVANKKTINLDNFAFKCDICKLGFKRRGMLVNHMAKRLVINC